MMTDEQPRLREALHRLADVPPPPDPGTAALRRAGRARRRRAALAGSAAVVAVGVALVGVRVGLPNRAAPATTGPTSAPTGGRYGVFSYRLQPPESMELGQARVLDPHTGTYRAVPPGTVFQPAPDGSRILLQQQQGVSVIDRADLLAGRFDRAWRIAFPDSDCESSWTADSRHVRCTGLLYKSGGLLVEEADVVTHRITSMNVRSPSLHGPHVFVGPGCRADEIVALVRTDLNSTGLRIVDYAGAVRGSYSLPGGWGLGGNAPMDRCSPDGRYVLGGDGRALDLRTGRLVGHAPPGPDSRFSTLGWYDDTHYVRVDFDSPRSVLRVVDVRSGAVVKSVVIGRDGRYRVMPWLTRLDALGPNPGPLVI
jgi:hypothetical protein